MLAAVLTTFLFAISTICGHRSARQIGGVEANFWRIAIATFLLTVWAYVFGSGLAGAPGWFMLSGLFGIGLGDSGYFQALPRLGARRTVLVVQCLTAPGAALIEWIWLGTTLNFREILCIFWTLTGVAIALAPGEHLQLPVREWRIGLVACVFAAIGGAFGAVLIRKAYEVSHAEGVFPDAGTTGYQRMLGGILIPAIILLAVKWRSARSYGGLWEAKTRTASLEKWRRIWPWVLANSLAGQTFGVTCMQWALKTTPTGIVTAIIATTPVLLLPMTRIVDGEKIGIRSLIGSLIAVSGVIGLIALRH
jgi:drug/metabolite transporter (DMT)-like permease